MEATDTYNFLFYGYTTIWFVVVFFLIRMVAEQRRVSQELSGLKDGTTEKAPLASNSEINS